MTPASSAFTCPTPPSAVAIRCPFFDGAETLDLLLGELAPSETDLLDAALDLRSAIQSGADAEDCLRQLFRLRGLLGERHYLAFYRMRRWVSRRICVEARADRACAWTSCPLALDCARIDEVENSCLAAIATDGVIPEHAQVRFIFRVE